MCVLNIFNYLLCTQVGKKKRLISHTCIEIKFESFSSIDSISTSLNRERVYEVVMLYNVNNWTQVALPKSIFSHCLQDPLLHSSKIWCFPKS